MLTQEGEKRTMQGTNDFLERRRKRLGIWSKQGTASQNGGSCHQTYQIHGRVFLSNKAEGRVRPPPRGCPAFKDGPRGPMRLPMWVVLGLYKEDLGVTKGSCSL